jgi:hypothetical protein
LAVPRVTSLRWYALMEGIAIATTIPMMATTVISSSSVNPVRS